jgi:hypothetical protein
MSTDVMMSEAANPTYEHQRSSTEQIVLLPQQQAFGGESTGLPSGSTSLQQSPVPDPETPSPLPSPPARSVFTLLRGGTPNGPANQSGLPRNADGDGGSSAAQAQRLIPHITRARGTQHRLAAQIRLPTTHRAEDATDGTTGNNNSNSWVSSLHLPSVLRGEINVRSEQVQGNTSTSRLSITLPIWVASIIIGLFIYCAVLFPYFVAELDDNLVNKIQNITTNRNSITDAYKSLATAAENTSYPTKSLTTRFLLQELVRVHVHCKSISPDIVSSVICPSPYPDGILYYATKHPFETWVLPNCLLQSPRVTILYLIFTGGKYGAGRAAQSTWFWFGWLFCPQCSILSLFTMECVLFSPMFVTVFILACVRFQVEEYKQLIFGHTNSMFFTILDGFVSPLIWLISGLLIPNFGQLTLLAVLWGKRGAFLLWPWKIFTRQPLRPFSRLLFHWIGQYVFTVLQRELPRTRTADYPFGYHSEPTKCEEAQCVICYNNKRDTALSPCCHVMCRTCADRLNTPKCPFCQTPFDRMQFIRL